MFNAIFNLLVALARIKIYIFLVELINLTCFLQENNNSVFMIIINKQNKVLN